MRAALHFAAGWAVLCAVFVPCWAWLCSRKQRPCCCALCQVDGAGTANRLRPLPPTYFFPHQPQHSDSEPLGSLRYNPPGTPGKELIQ